MESNQVMVKPDATTSQLVQSIPLSLPDHTQLPESDGTFVKNFQEHPQSIVLTSSIEPILQKLHPDGNYCIGQDSGIYWRLTEPAEKGAEAPDWFYVGNVPPLIDGEYRRSYVLWKEFIAPLIAIEFVSGNGAEERDATPPNDNQKAGKFWVYEQAIRIPYYVIFDARRALLDCYHLVDGRYEKSIPNQHGHYLIAPMGVELGLQNEGETLWLRWWDQSGNLLQTGDERATHYAAIAEQERQQKQRLADYLRSIGVDPDVI